MASPKLAFICWCALYDLQLATAQNEHESDQAKLNELRDQVAGLEAAVGQAVEEIEAQNLSQAERDNTIASLTELLDQKDLELQARSSSSKQDGDEMPSKSLEVISISEGDFAFSKRDKTQFGSLVQTLWNTKSMLPKNLLRLYRCLEDISIFFIATNFVCQSIVDIARRNHQHQLFET